ncbi:MAG: hypothetical protein GXO08_04700 [Aquificae bacterium]|nr:hypothetical protein [Aquificota bacterium]
MAVKEVKDIMPDGLAVNAIEGWHVVRLDKRSLVEFGEEKELWKTLRLLEEPTFLRQTVGYIGAFNNQFLVSRIDPETGKTDQTTVEFPVRDVDTDLKHFYITTTDKIYKCEENRFFPKEDYELKLVESMDKGFKSISVSPGNIFLVSQNKIYKLNKHGGILKEVDLPEAMLVRSDAESVFVITDDNRFLVMTPDLEVQAHNTFEGAVKKFDVGPFFAYLLTDKHFYVFSKVTAERVAHVEDADHYTTFGVGLNHLYFFNTKERAVEAVHKRDLLEAGMGEIPLEVLMEYMLAALMMIEKITGKKAFIHVKEGYFHIHVGDKTIDFEEFIAHLSKVFPETYYFFYNKGYTRYLLTFGRECNILGSTPEKGRLEIDVTQYGDVLERNYFVKQNKELLLETVEEIIKKAS